MLWYNILAVVIIVIIIIGLDVYTPKGSEKMKNLYMVGLIVLWIVVYNFVFPKLRDGFDNPDTRVDQPCPEGSVKHRNGDCRMKGEGEAP